MFAGLERTSVESKREAIGDIIKKKQGTVMDYSDDCSNTLLKHLQI